MKLTRTLTPDKWWVRREQMWSNPSDEAQRHMILIDEPIMDGEEWALHNNTLLVPTRDMGMCSIKLPDIIIRTQANELREHGTILTARYGMCEEGYGGEIMLTYRKTRHFYESGTNNTTSWRHAYKIDGKMKWYMAYTKGNGVI